MDFAPPDRMFSPPRSASSAARGGLGGGSPGTGTLGSYGSPGVEDLSRKQMDWEREIETLDQKEMELHQSQLRLIREQTAIFIRDLGTLQGEVAALKEGLGAGMTTSMLNLQSDLQESQARNQTQEHQVLALQKRVDYLERLLGESADRHSQELESVKSAHSRFLSDSKTKDMHHASVAERLGYVEKLVGDSFEKHSKEIQSSHSRLEQMQQMHSRLEAQLSSVDNLKAAHSDVASQLVAREASHSSLQERVDYLEKLMGESADHHAKGLDATQSKLEELHGGLEHSFSSKMEQLHGSVRERLERLERSVGETEEKRGREFEDHKSTMQQRLTYLESMIGDSMDKHSRELERHRHELETTKGKLDSAHSKLGSHQQSLTHHASLGERMSYVEKLLGDSADRHGEEFGEANAKLDQLRSRLSAVENHGATIEGLKKSHSVLVAEKAKRDAHHASMAERVDYIEKTLGDSADKHAKELSVAHAKLEQIHGRLAVWEKQGTGILDQQRSQETTMADERAAMHAHHATLRERVDFLEAAMGDSADKHSREIDALKESHKRLHTDSKSRDSHHASVAERLAYLEKAFGDSADKHAQELAVAHGKLDQMHSRIVGCESSSLAVDGLKKAHASMSSDKASMDSKHASIEERLGYLERTMGDSADKHAKELKAAHDKMDQLHGRLSTHDKNGARLQALDKAHADAAAEARSQLNAVHASMAERLAYLEGQFGDSADKHAKELEALKVSHSRVAADAKARDAHHSSVAERLDYVEKLLGDSAEKHAQELKAAHSKIEQVHSRVSGSLPEDAMRSMIQSEREARLKHHSTMEDRLAHLEKMLGETHERHGREIEATKSAHSRLAKEQKTRDDRHASVADRLEYLEQKVGDSADAHARELKAAQSKLDQLHSRLEHAERAGSAVQELHKAHGAAHAESKAALATHHASLNERLDFLEQRVGDSADKQVKELEAVKSAHGRMATEHKARDAHHASVAERLDYVEKMLGDSADKHADEIQAAHAKLDQMHARVMECETRVPHIDSLRKSHASLQSDLAMREAHHSSVGERLDYLEKVCGDSADHHKKELQAARQAQDQLQQRLHDERSQREQAHGQFEAALHKEREGRSAHHASFEERLQKLESFHSELHDRHGELKEHVQSEAMLRHQHAESLEEQLANERRAREAHERSVQSHLAGERKARELHEGLVGEQFQSEKAARDRSHAHLSELLGREKDARDKHHETHQDLLSRERAANETRHRDVHDAISKERSMREEHHNMVHDFLHKEKAGRMAIEDLLAQEKAERSKHHASIEDRVESVQKTMGVFDNLIRKEIEERTKEYRRIWDAIDNHTHDLSTQLLPDALSQAVTQEDSLHRSATPPATVNGGSWVSPMQSKILPSPMNTVAPMMRQVTHTVAPVVRVASPLPTSAYAAPCAPNPLMTSTSHCSGNLTPHAPMDTKCPGCGNIYMSDANFCRHCGRRRGEVPLSPTLSNGPRDVFPRYYGEPVASDYTRDL